MTMKLRRKKAAEFLDRLSLLLEKKVKKLGEEDVHHIRTNSRKAEALLEILPAKLVLRTKAASALKKLRKRAGAVRDADVQIGLLQGLAAKDPAIEEQKQYLLDALHMQRLMGQRRLEKFLDDYAAKIRRHLRDLCDGLPKSQPLSALEKAFENDPNATLREALRRYRDLKRQYPVLDQRNLHDFRKRCKQIRYLAEMGKQTPESSSFVEQLTAMQDAIGSWHDWQTLRILAFDLGMHRDLVAFILLLEDLERRKYIEAMQIAATVTANVATILHGKPVAHKKPPSANNNASKNATKSKPEKAAAMSLLLPA